MAGRPPQAPGKGGSSPNNFSQGWTTTSAKSSSWRRSLSATNLNRSKSRLDGSPDTSAIPALPTSPSGYQPGQMSDRFRSAGAEVVRTPPRKPSADSAERGRSEGSNDQETDHDVHCECRARIYSLSSDLAEATQALKALQRDQEKILRQMGNERQDFRLLQKTYSESEQQMVIVNIQLKKHKEEISCSREEHEEYVIKVKPWEEMEEQTVAKLRLSLQQSEAREHQLNGSISAQKLAGQANVDRLQGALRHHEDNERTAMESLAASQEKDLQFAELREKVKSLSAKSWAQDEALEERASQVAALKSEYAESSASEGVLRRELDKYRNDLAGEMSAALAEQRAVQEQSTEHRVSELCAERDEALRLAKMNKTGELAAKAKRAAVEKRLSTCESAQAESSSAAQAREKEMHDLQAKSTKTATKKEAEVRMLATQLEQSKTEIAELYDALVRASENSNKSSSKRNSAKF